jgi:hypothetical protein
MYTRVFTKLTFPVAIIVNFLLNRYPNLTRLKLHIRVKLIVPEPNRVDFLTFLCFLAVTLIQDSCLLLENENFKNHSIFNHPLFKSKALTDFRAEAVKISPKIAPERNPRLELVAPLLQQAAQQTRKIIIQESNIMQRKIDNLESKMNEIVTEKVTGPLLSLFFYCFINETYILDYELYS